jgi:hypothetical protein
MALARNVMPRRSEEWEQSHSTQRRKGRKGTQRTQRNAKEKKRNLEKPVEEKKQAS